VGGGQCQRQLTPAMHTLMQVSVAEWLVHPTAVLEDRGSNLTAGGCVYCDSSCDMQPWARDGHIYCSV